MGNCPEVILFRKLIGFENFLAHKLSRRALPLHFFHRNLKPTQRLPLLTIVSQNRDPRFNPQLVNVPLHFLTNSIDQVGPHRVTRIDVVIDRVLFRIDVT